MGQLRSEDVAWCVRRLPQELRTAAAVQLTANAFPPAFKTIVVAGGFIRSVIAGEEINDVDVFTDSAESASALELDLVRRTNTTAIRTPNAITIRTNPAIQIITRWIFSGHDALAHCIESFDFTIARAGLELQRDGTWTSYCDDDFYSDLAAKRLRYRHPDRREDEAGSLLRLLKFYRKGYRAPLIDIAGVVARAVKGMSGGDLADDELVRRDFIMARLRVVDPAVDPEQEGHLG